MYLVILVAPVWTSGNSLLKNPLEYSTCTLSKPWCLCISHLSTSPGTFGQSMQMQEGKRYVWVLFWICCGVADQQCLLESSSGVPSGARAQRKAEFLCIVSGRMQIQLSLSLSKSSEWFFLLVQTPQILADFPKVSRTYLLKDVPMWHTWPAWHSLEKHVHYQLIVLGLES